MACTFTAGFIIADTSEYEPVREWCLAHGGRKIAVLNRDAVSVTLNGSLRTVDLIAVCCGIGKVNAATLAAFTAAEFSVDLIVNAGLSGGLLNSPVGQTVIGDKFIEYDFDLTPLGYEPAEKPGQKYIYTADGSYVSDLKLYFACESVTCVTGDRFVNDSHTADNLVARFGAGCCDMETAAIASVCNDFDIPFACIRRISDSGDEKQYSSAAAGKQTWMVKILDWIRSLTDRVIR